MWIKKYLFVYIFIIFISFVIFLFSNVTGYFFSKINSIDIVKIDGIPYNYSVIGNSNKIPVKYLLSEDFIFEIIIDDIDDFYSFNSLQIDIDGENYDNNEYFSMNTQNNFYFGAKGLRRLLLNSESKVFKFKLCYNTLKNQEIKCIYSDDISILGEYNRFNDTYSYLQYYIKDMNIDTVKNSIKNNYTPIIAIIDDGIIVKNDDFEGRYWINENEIEGNLNDDDGNGFVDDYYGWNFVNSNNDMSIKGNHGTSVAGIIGANTNNNFGIVGITNNVKLMPIIACSYICDENNLASAIRYAVHNGADIINLSLGGDFIKNNEYLSEVIKYAIDNGVIIVSSAGNGYDLIGGSEGLDTGTHKIFPVCNENQITDIIGVSALSLFSDKTKNGLKAYWSNFGKCIDFSAPGDKIVSSSTIGSYSINDGTSFSAPIVSGIIGLGFNKYGKIDREIIYKSLLSSTDKWYGIDAKKYIKELEKNLKK